MGGSAKLSSLFAAEDQLTSPSISLGYTAKKATKAPQPAPSTSPAAPTSVPSSTTTPASATPSTPTVLYAALINLLRYDPSNQPTPIGQRAVAILRTSIPPLPHPTHVLVAYEPTSQRQDTSTPIADLSLSLTPGYASFYDLQRHCYAINAPQDQLELLARHVAMAKHAQAAQTNAQPGLVVQDLVAGAGERGVGTGDQVKVKYSMYLTSPTHPKAVGALVGHVGSDEKPKQVKVGGKKELVGVEAGLMGMRKGGRRFLVIPPHLGYGGQQAGSIPPHSTLLVEVTCIKIKHSGDTTSAPSPSPTPTPTPTPSLPTPSLPAPGGAPLPPPSPTPSDDDDVQRRDLTRKMAHMGFKMPGLPGATDPEHLRVERVEESRRGSVDSRAGEGMMGDEVPSPALSSVSVATSAPPLHLPPVAPGPAQFLHHQQHPHAQQQQQQTAPQPPPHQQPQHPSGPYYQQQQQPPQQQAPYYSQPQHAQQASNPYSSSFSAPSPYPYGQDSHYNNSAPSPSHHTSPSHTPHPSHASNNPYQPYNPAPPTHHHSSSLSHLPTPSSFPPPLTSSSPLLQSIDTKLDSLLSSFSQQSRILGTHNPSLMYDPPLSGAHIIRALQSMMGEREEWKGKADDRERRIADLQAKLTSMQERMEKQSEDSQRLMERRYEAHADEMKAKSGQLMELQQAVRKAEHEAQQAGMARQEMEGRMGRLEEDLVRAKEEGKMRAEFERQVGLLQVQLRQANEAVVGKEQEGRLVMEQRVAAKESEIASLQREAAATKEEEARERALLQSTIDSLKAQLQEAQQTADERIQQLSAAVAAAEDERTRLQGEVERSHGALERLQQSSVPHAEHQALQEEMAAAALRARELQREVDEEKAETASIIDQARSRRETDRQQFLALLEQAKAEEYERGQAETMEEAKAGMQAMREKARATIDQLAQEKEALEERVQVAEQEREELVATSRAYIDKLKAQMQVRLQEAADAADSGREAEAEQAEAARQAALKAVYSGLSRQLQERGERRWRAQEVAQLVRAEVQFALTGDRPEVELADEEEAPQPSPQPPPPTEMAMEKQSPAGPPQAVETTEQTEEPPRPASPPPAAKEREEQEEVKEEAKEEQPAAALPEEAAPQHSEEKSEEHTTAIEGAKEETNSQSTSAPATEEVREEVAVVTPPAPEAESVPQASSSPSADAADRSNSADAATAPALNVEAKERPASPAPLPAAAAVDANGQEEEKPQPLVSDLPVPAPPSPAKGEPQAEVPPAYTSYARSPSVNPSDTNGVDVTNTFEYPHSGAAIPAPSAPAAVKEGGEGEEGDDRLAPLRPPQGAAALSVDPSSPTSSSSSSTITPPTPTLLTPPAAAHRSQGQSGPPSPASRSPSAISDPFADPFADDVEEPVKRPAVAVAAATAAAPAAVKRTSTSSLFADDDEDGDGGLFAAPVKVASATKAKVTPVKKASLFGDDDDDDDGGLFKM